MLIFSLVKSNFKGLATSFRAMVQSQGTLSLEQTIQRMIRRGSTVTEADASAALHDFFYVAEDLLLDGYHITTPFGTLALTIRGRFDSETEALDHNKQWVELILKPSAPFRRKLRSRAQVQRKPANPPHPRLSRCKNLNNGETNTTLTPGGDAHLFGEQLNFDQTDPNQGIFIIPANGNGNGDAIRVERVLHNSGRKLAFVTPDNLTPGEYRVEVRSLFGKEDIRAGALKETLTVA